MRIDRLRNRVAWWLANQILLRVATREYRAALEEVILLGRVERSILRNSQSRAAAGGQP